MTLRYVVDCDSDVTMRVECPAVHRCPYVDERDSGVIVITWRVQGKTFELHSLAAYIAAFADSELSHEQITDRVRHDLSTSPGLDVISVESTWTTAGMEVQCATSPTQPETP